jgi:hypothetical protein
MKPLYLILSLLSCVACSVSRQVTPSENTRVEVRTETVIQQDTVFLELPVIARVVETLDTASTIENKYAKSTASVSNGVLAHSLSTKAVKEPVIVDRQVVYRDSLVYVDKVREVKVEVEKPLTVWQQIRQTLGSIALLAISVWIVKSIIKHLLTL